MLPRPRSAAKTLVTPIVTAGTTGRIRKRSARLQARTKPGPGARKGNASMPPRSLGLECHLAESAETMPHESRLPKASPSMYHIQVCTTTAGGCVQKREACPGSQSGPLSNAASFLVRNGRLPPMAASHQHRALLAAF
ncbi:hypothetical protein GGTG_05047 [Gaeumannomyces tritici R3-111a-1]|uniref:Uncharacterized protein n=1 Tax=Gaeumannomyces tritici (strain R3-111a-1) TaxID=644352 RepID=J3NUU1_GAET3|nr:hypothetical protein GGTG_05047 [Gaeumannomyces tritici R3-111a-1]EJT79965.1 hypothetical protein GGTG_05047 [Gaeumannomyces tritici R3-111a-1]